MVIWSYGLNESSSEAQEETTIGFQALFISVGGWDPIHYGLKAIVY